jgi:hypothetical protein
MAKKIKRKIAKKIVKKTKKAAKKQNPLKIRMAEREPKKRKVNWAALPGEEPTEEEYLDEDYPEEEGFGTEEGTVEKVKAPEDDYEKLPIETENVEEEEEN